MSAIYDLIERVLTVGDVHDKRMAELLESELSAKDAALEAANAALTVCMWELEFTGDDDLISAHCAGCYVERGDLENGADSHSEGCVIASALAASREQG